MKRLLRNILLKYYDLIGNYKDVSTGVRVYPNGTIILRRDKTEGYIEENIRVPYSEISHIGKEWGEK